MGTFNTFEYLDHNLFVSAEMHFVQWEGKTGTFLMMHTVCANILRHFFGVENDCKVEDFVKICEIEKVLGRPKPGKDASRIPFVPYEKVGDPKDQADVRPFWQHGGDPGMNLFAWKLFSESPMGWALSRPDVFPLFFSEPKHDRFTSLCEPASQPGVFARLPLDILIMILPHLSTTSFVTLSATCRLLRLYATTVFQPHARSLVLSLGWATPLLGLGEYQAAISQNPKNALHLVHPIKSPRTGDWFLYLSHVHRTPSMRARRRIWNICEAVLRAVDKKLPASKYGKRLDMERSKIETHITHMHQAMLGMRELIELSKTGASLVPTHGWTGGHVHIPTNNQ
ncbi:hypothetical protein JB92DRAFT_2860723 [Gautieria morchelliformis]|nr:hypothetical protein JB92DRAFT_2860723 [Gautieria morchelliformis]